MSSRPIPTACLTLVLAHGVSAMAAGQSPTAAWRTLPTAHYRIHFPEGPSFRTFAEAAAVRIEGIHALLEKEVGHALPGPTDVLVLDPVMAANGMVVPALHRPTVTLWTTPPDSDSEIGHSSRWIDLLILHELVHLHHLTWPDAGRSFPDLSPVRFRRLTKRAPAWIVEGYATYLEGRLTGEGRPHSTYRATVLRQLAREGMLPSYGGMNGVSAPLSTGLRYQVGSAFMEWLAARHPARERAWPDLWKRMASKRMNTFDEAFKATFGDLPAALYGRFQAEVTHSALEMERRFTAAGLREGTLWSQSGGTWVQDLTVSPDGTRLAATLESEKLEQAGIAVFDLEPPKTDGRPTEGRPTKVPSKTPDLPPPVPPLNPTHKPKHELHRVAFSLPRRPQWQPDGTLKVEIQRRESEGTYHPEPWIWQPETRPATPVTIRFLRPVLVENHWQVDLGTRVLSLPFEPFGPLALDTTRHVLYASTPIHGVHAIVRLPLEAEGRLGAPQVLTRSVSGDVYPAPTPDGKALYYCQPSGRGSRIRRLDLTQPPFTGPAPEPEPAPFAPDAVLPRQDEATQVLRRDPVPADHPYRTSESHALNLALGALAAPAQTAWLLGAQGQDVLGRLSWTAQVALGPHGAPGPNGGHAGMAWRGWAWSPSLHAFQATFHPSEQAHAPVQGWDHRRTGLELAVTREWWPNAASGRLVLSTARERVGARPGLPDLDRTQMGLDLRQGMAWNRDAWTLRTSGRIRYAGGRTGDQAWNIARAHAALSLAWEDNELALEAEGGRIGGSPTPFDQFTLGSQSTGIVAQSLEAQAVWQAALPQAFVLGDRLRRTKASLGPLYLERVRVWDRTLQAPPAVRVAGLVLRESIENMAPLQRDMLQRLVGRPELELGLHRPLDGPSRGRTVLTLALRQRF